MNENEAMDHDDLFEDDELMKKVSKPPEFPPATREQIEETWQSIVGNIEARHAEVAEPRDVAGKPQKQASPQGRLAGWLESLFPSAPAWSGQLARVAALLVVGFAVAWFAANQGWLPGTGTPQDATVADEGSPDAAPNRDWMAANDYGERLEALLLGLTRGEAAGGDSSLVRELSREMLDDNRFYRRVANRNDDASLAQLLSRVEIILLVLATTPEGEEDEVIENLRQFIGESDLIGELREARSSVPRVAWPQVTRIGS